MKKYKPADENKTSFKLTSNMSLHKEYKLSSFILGLLAVIVLMTFIFGNIIGFVISFAFFAFSAEINAERLKFLIVNYPIVEVLTGSLGLIAFIYIAAILPVKELYKRSIYSLVRN